MSQDIPKDEKKRENVFEVLEEIISHLHTTRHLFIFLIASAFVLAPIALVMAALLLSPPPFIEGDIVQTSAVANLTHPPVDNMIYHGMVNTTSGSAPFGATSGSISIGAAPGMQVITLPNNSLTISTAAPRFVFVGGPPGFGHLADLTAAILVFIAISVILASIWLFIGLKEYRFFSKWNRKFSRYISIKDKLDMELEKEED